MSVKAPVQPELFTQDGDAIPMPLPMPLPKVTFCTVKFSIGWLPGAIGLTEQAKAALSADLNIDKRVIRGNYAILGASRDPLIQEGAALKQLLTTVRNTYTIPEVAVTTTAASDQPKPEKVPGSYLIESTRIEEFLTRFNEVREQYLAWGKRVAEPENYERIRNADQVALGKDWDIIASKYPTPAKMMDAISCDIPRIEPYNASFTLEDVAPATAEKLKKQAEARLEASISGATAELVVEFKEMVEAVARNCGRRIRVNPSVSGPFARFHNAEVQEIVKHQQNDDIPAGKMLVTLQPYTQKGDKLIRNGKAEDLLLTEQEYKDMRPFETGEYKSLTNSAFENLMHLANKIQSVKTMLGDGTHASSLSDLADQVKTILGNFGGSAEAITKQLKNSSYVRSTAKDAFAKIAKNLAAQEIEIRQEVKLKRKIQFSNPSDE